MAELIEKSNFFEKLEHAKTARFAVAIALVAVSWSLREALAPILPGQTLFLYFMPAVLFSAWIGGLWPGLLATALSVASALFLVSDALPLSLAVYINTGAFVIIGIGVSWGGELLHRGRLRTNAMTRDALAQQAHLQSILDTVPEAMIVIDERGIMQYFSSAAERLTFSRVWESHSRRGPQWHPRYQAVRARRHEGHRAPHLHPRPPLRASVAYHTVALVWHVRPLASYFFGESHSICPGGRAEHGDVVLVARSAERYGDAIAAMPMPIHQFL